MSRLLSVMHLPASRMEFVAMGGPDLVAALTRAAIFQAHGKVWSLPCREPGEVECERVVRERDGQYFAVCGRQGDPCLRDDRVEGEDLIELSWNAIAWSGWLRGQCGLLSRQAGRVLPAGALLLGDRPLPDGTRRAVYWLPDPRALDAPQFFADLVIGEAGRQCWVLVPDLGRVPADRDASLRGLGVHVVEVADRVSCEGGRLEFRSANVFGGPTPAVRPAAGGTNGRCRALTSDAPMGVDHEDLAALAQNPEANDLFINFTEPLAEGRHHVWTRLRPEMKPDWVVLSATDADALRIVLSAEGGPVDSLLLTSRMAKKVDAPHKALERARSLVLGDWRRGRMEWLPTIGRRTYRWSPPKGGRFTIILKTMA